MNVEQMTARINELYHKSQNEGLTPEEKEEQLDNISIVEKDGSITDLGKKHGNK